MKNKKMLFRLIVFIAILPVNISLAQKLIFTNEINDIVEISEFGTVLFQSAKPTDVLSGNLDAEFVPFKSNEINEDNKEYWIRFAIVNNSPTPQKYLIGTSKFDRISFYIDKSSGEYELINGGIQSPNKEKKFNVGHFSFADISVAPGDTAVNYIQALNQETPFFQFVPLDLTLHTERYFQTAYGNTRTFNLIFLGIVAIMALYNLILMFITRDKSYLYYVGYNVSILGYVFALSGDATALFFPDATFQENLVLITGILGLAFYVLFARSILELKVHFKKWDKILRYIVGIACLALIPTIFNWLHIAIPICFFIALIAYPVILILGFFLVLKKNVPATYFFIANSIYIVLLMISILQMLGVLPTFIFGLQANVFVQIGVSLELALFSLGLGARIISIREKTLKESEERLSQFLEAMPVGVFVLDEKGHPYYTNKAAEKLLKKGMESGLDGNELAGFYETYKSGTNDTYPTEELPVIKALKGESTSVEDMELRIDDKVVSLEVSATPIYDEKKNIISSLAIFQDISQRLKAKKQLEDYNQTLEQKVKERTLEITEQKNEIEKEKEKVDSLLLNILPEEVAQELKEFGKSDARLFQEVSVMFTDFVNFTKISELLSPEQLVFELDYCFQKFDEIITKNDLEKIKTIGDSYLSVCGLPAPDEQHALKIVKSAIEILDFITKYAKKRKAVNKPYFEIRIGIHSGPVVAGIVGVKKFAFDIWGDTVNTASRLETTSEPGKINISGKTHELVKEDFEFEYRGKINAKNKGNIDMYFVKKKI